MAPRNQHLPAAHSVVRTKGAGLGFNVDAVAISLALALAALIRLNVIHRIGW